VRWTLSPHTWYAITVRRKAIYKAQASEKLYHCSEGVNTVAKDLQLMHQRFGHINHDYVFRTNDHVRRMENIKSLSHITCNEICALEKAHQAHMVPSDKAYSRTGVVVHVDI